MQEFPKKGCDVRAYTFDSNKSPTSDPVIIRVDSFYFRRSEVGDSRLVSFHGDVLLHQVEVPVPAAHGGLFLPRAFMSFSDSLKEGICVVRGAAWVREVSVEQDIITEEGGVIEVVKKFWVYGSFQKAPD